MWPVFPASLTLLAIAGIVVVVLATLRYVQPAWGRSRTVRLGALVAFGVMLLGVALWGIGSGTSSARLIHLGAGIAYGGVLVVAPAALLLPLAAAADRFLLGSGSGSGSGTAGAADTCPAGTRVRAAPKNETRTKVTRRALIRFGSASVPAMAALTSASGLVSARSLPTMPVVRLRWPELHPDLHGLRILHLSDVHLGAYFGIEHVARALAVARATHRPDLVVLTGDLADDPSLIPDALRLVAASGARYGALASLGNHEYLHGIERTRPHYEASAVPLLVGSGRTLRIGRATLFVGGADDPVHMSGDIAGMLRPSIAASLRSAPPRADFKLLLCHRPEGHGPASELGYDLTLSGHTHGGQLGFFGRSMLEQLRPGVGWWGAYAKRRADTGAPSRLYTTSGFGHWFPFRVGCPTEMPLIVLEASERAARGKALLTGRAVSASRPCTRT